MEAILDMTKLRREEHFSSDFPDEMRALDAKLDAALADTFPASDPVAITGRRSRPEHVEERIQPGLQETPREWTGVGDRPRGSR
jgi:hypothetical protein